MDGVCVELAIGERIRRLRKAALMTQDDLAAAAGVSTDLIRKLEQGRRHTASIASLSRIARALGVELAELLGPARVGSDAGQDKGRVRAIRDALTSVDDLLGELDGIDVPDVTELARAVSYAWGTFWAGRYESLAAMLPRLLADAQAATYAATVADSGRVADLAAQVHQITAGTLLRFGEADLSHVAARESLRLAAGAPDPLRLASARYVFGHVLIAQGRYVDAERVSVATAREGRTAAAKDLLIEAGTAAQRTGMDRIDYDVIFGPSNLVMQSTDCSIVAEDYVAAADLARRMPRDSALPVVSRSRHLADVAHAQLRLGPTHAAESALLTMERTAPEWTAHHRLPRLLVGELLTRRPSSLLRELAQRLHVTRGSTTTHQDE